MINVYLNTNKERSYNGKKYLKLSDILLCLIVSIFSSVVIFLCVVFIVDKIVKKSDIIIWKEKENGVEEF